MEPAARRERLARARLVFVVDAGCPRELVAGALAGGVDVVQLRDPAATPGAAGVVADLCNEHRALFVVAGRTDLPADGVHFESDRRPAAAGLLVGVSVQTAEEAAAADTHYLFVGPVWPTPTKPGHPGIGLEALRQAAGKARVPVFAVGGVHAGNAAEAVAARAQGVAVIRAIRDAPDPAAAASELRQAVTSAAGPTMPA
jgi:thiamine-phosphate pyrophosphorylase